MSAVRTERNLVIDTCSCVRFVFNSLRLSCFFIYIYIKKGDRFPKFRVTSFRKTCVLDSSCDKFVNPVCPGTFPMTEKFCVPHP